MSSTEPDRYFVLGNPVAHSQSPFIHNAFAQQTGERLVYDRRLCEPGGFAAAVRTLASDRAGGRVGGCNVTVPFKFEVPALASQVTPRAALAQAANVLRFDADGWLADNTDGIGLLRDLQQNQGLELQGQRVLLVGAGGAAAGVLGPLIEARPALVCVANRSAGKAEDLVRRHAGLADRSGVRLIALGLDALAAAGADGLTQGVDLVINASASSLSGAGSPVPAAVVRGAACAVDLMYGPAAQPFLQWALAHGARRAADGLGMLVEQAAEAFWLWRGVRPDTAPVLAALRQRVQSP
jgi:shikimate dehydrogenase